ncbi:MarR family winged helix-turn-helix transcriptional regulator [Spongiactinospora sp. TRM90649]|uniref:MarR family winged helix-turn-helix transcriptional regulator n=1 Tax=Spongiactinospora sp. TRM90649 TaxID=3031114 RepID=UPI0023F76DE9|nr:MarR family winged helix-turn-helix transcriptional regulator [Spongiactinospora sp. TRM90649]MDF5758724.1 MarR family winged helix-turn-helix transcriptional regulator [Spongiactinospora sp. TRM90649]
MEVQQATTGTAIDVALFRLRRMWARPLRPRKVGDPARPIQMSNVMVVGAVSRLERECSEVTVGGVAEHMDVDPSTASRLVNDAIAAGFVERAASNVDARRVRLVPSEAGRRVLDAVTRHRRGYLDSLMADWSQDDRETFARLITRLAEASVASPADLARLDEVIAEALEG